MEAPAIRIFCVKSKSVSFSYDANFYHGYWSERTTKIMQFIIVIK